MIGRQEIKTNRAFSLAELERFMQEHWDTLQYNEFIIGHPTPASFEDYILLPATERYLVAVYSRKAGGLFNRNNKVILIVCDTPQGAVRSMLRSVPMRNPLISAYQLSKVMSAEQERKGPAEEILQKYTAYMRGLLDVAGHTLK